MKRCGPAPSCPPSCAVAPAPASIRLRLAAIPCCGGCWPWSRPAPSSCSACVSSWRPCPLAWRSRLGGLGQQVARHGRVLSELTVALAALAAGLERLPQRPAVTLLAVSEFGLRLRENGSGGTDHGSASVALVFGEQLPERLIGQYPSLSDLDDRSDLIASLAPPELYRQVLAVAGM